MNEIAVELEIEAEAELYKIVEYYKRFDQELPKDFIREFEDAVQKLMNFPNAGHPYLHQTKRVFLNRFPYAVVYKIYKENLVIVFAIMHMRRKPDYWKDRLK